MHHPRIVLSLITVLVLQTLATAQQGKPKRPFPFLEAEVPSKMKKIVSDAVELADEIATQKELAANGNKTAARKLKRLLEKRDEYALDLEDEINDELEDTEKERKKLAEKLQELGDRLKQFGSNPSRRASIEKDLREVERQLDYYASLEKAYDMLTAHVRGDRPAGTPYALLGAPAPKFVGQTYNPKAPPFKLQNHIGKGIILVFFATVNKNSMDQLSDMYRVTRGYNDKQAILVGINVDDDREEAQSFVKNRRPNFAVIDDSSWAIRKQYSVHFIPQIVLINRDGVVTRVQVGDVANSRNRFSDELKKVLK